MADQGRIKQIDLFWRAANYLSVAELYLKENALLKTPLKSSHIKPRLLGHWGTVPGLNLIHAHLNRLIQDTSAGILPVIGPGHGAPGPLACMFLEGVLQEYYPHMSMDEQGINDFVKSFSWPGGLPSHLTPLAPGAIQEGGELGYCLVHAFGAVFDAHELIAVPVIGDGEAETGTLAASWHCNKFINPQKDGAVLPILHLNGFKISNPTILGRMDDEALSSLFYGYGYEARFVDGNEPEKVHAGLYDALDWAYSRIREIQKTGELPLWPMLILKTPKGWTGPKALEGKQIEGSFRSHQIPIKDPKGDPKELAALEKWLKSYRPEEFFGNNGALLPQVREICPRHERLMARNPYANSGLYSPLLMPDWSKYSIFIPKRGRKFAEGTRLLGEFLKDLIIMNSASNNFRIFCPDEMDSNRLSGVFKATSRVFMLPADADENISKEGRVVEILNENICQGLLEGYLLTGRHGLFVSYEAFITIVDSMVSQFAKWIKVSDEIPWRQPMASLNYLLTSHSWRQDHNGYSHQGPGFINTMMTKKNSVVRIYLPPDANCLLRVARHCLESRDYINLIIASKQPMPQWLDAAAAEEHFLSGASQWEWAGNGSENPDVVLACAGDVPTLETLAAAWILKRKIPELRFRVVNVIDLFSLVDRRDHTHGLDGDSFVRLFTSNAPVVFAFHGYPRVIHELIHKRPDASRFHVKGYIEEGSTTTPFDMAVENRISRFHMVIEALTRAKRFRARTGDLVKEFEKKLIIHRQYIKENGEDMPEVAGWRWSEE